jgi:RNA polymerase sigma-70 factor (ECF subfamily)
VVKDIKIKLKDGKGSYSFNQCFTQMFPSMCIYAEKYVGEYDIAKDIVQEMFLKLWGIFSDFDSDIAIKAYLYRSIRNATINYLEHLKVEDKYSKRKLAEINSEQNFLSQIIEKETHRIIYQAIEELPKKRKQIILLSINGLSNPEIAKKLDISINTIKTQKSEAYKQLRESLKNIYSLIGYLIIG